MSLAPDTGSQSPEQEPLLMENTDALSPASM